MSDLQNYLAEHMRFKNLFLGMLLCGLVIPENGAVMSQKPHVLFIAIDDLRPDLGCNGHPVVQSPHLDKLAESAIVFDRHYATVPTCGASRFSLLSGMYPRTPKAANNRAMMELLANANEPSSPETFIHHLRRNNYYTVGIGKISHSADGLVYGYEDPPSDQLELPYSWDEMLLDAGKWGNGWNAFFGYADGSNRQGRKKQVFPYEFADVDEAGYPDGLSATLAIKKLEELAQREAPFFLGVGFFKPHLPFTAPKKYWDLYDRTEIALSPTPDFPVNVHKASLQKMGELNNYQKGEEKASLDHPFTDDYARKLIHGYYACISYTDALVGMVIDKLKSLGLYENTLIIVWGDHGWHLGDHRVWGKHTLFERSLKSALMIKPPQYDGPGRNIDAIVSTVDVYPTVMKLCDIEMPHQTDGRDMTCLWQSGGQPCDWEAKAYGYFRRGITFRTNRYRISKYFRDEEPTVEIFDHVNDPFETTNITSDEGPLKASLMVKLMQENPASSYWRNF